MKRWFLALGVAALVGGPALAQRYDYGGGGHGSGVSGFVLEIEAGVGSPRNTDNVVAAVCPNVIIPTWSGEATGRLGFGYRFASGSKLLVSFWGIDADQSEAGIGSFSFPVGPVTGFEFDVTTNVQAQTADVAWGFTHDATESFALEWSVGLRYADYEETTDGTYGTTSGTLAVDKLNQGTMLGARVAGRATYRVGSLSAGAGVGLSMLDGEVEARSSLAPQPSGTLAQVLTDDSRSGKVVDLEVRGAWHNRSATMSVWIGWESQEWVDIAADLARNLPGSGVVARERDSVTFSWAKAGVSFIF